MGAWGETGEGWYDTDPNELVFTFGVFDVCVNFGENRSNVTVRVRTDGRTNAQTQTGCIICRMLYAIAMEQIMICTSLYLCTGRLKSVGYFLSVAVLLAGAPRCRIYRAGSGALQTSYTELELALLFYFIVGYEKLIVSLVETISLTVYRQLLRHQTPKTVTLTFKI